MWFLSACCKAALFYSDIIRDLTANKFISTYQHPDGKTSDMSEPKKEKINASLIGASVFVAFITSISIIQFVSHWGIEFSALNVGLLFFVLLPVFIYSMHNARLLKKKRESNTTRNTG
jgi:hypothetical protein